MSIKPHPTKPGEWIIDCRPDGYKGKRERITFPGTEEMARAFERRMMRQHVDVTPPSARTLAGIYPAWMASYRIDRSPRTVTDVMGVWRLQLKEAFGKLQPKVLPQCQGSCRMN